jgi:HAD superfamily hydrolase (TIGR01456 family)
MDIDGVFRRGNQVIPNSLQALQLLQTPLSQFSSKFKGINAGLPFVFITNGGGHLESYKANELNRILGITNPNKGVKAEDMILCHTPLREIVAQYADDYIIIAGLGDILSIAHDYGFKKAITLDEYSAMFPYLSRLSLLGKSEERVQMLAERGRQRFNFVKDAALPQVKAVFYLSDPTMWEENLQITCDLLISKDGIPGSIRSKNDPQFVKLYLTNPDIVFADAFTLPRIAQGSYLLCLDALFKRQYGMPIEFTYYGKPTANTFKFAERYLRQRHIHQFNISHFYMIGDNPEGDIKGANMNGWQSILVRTGLFKGPENDPHNPATFIKENILESIKFIMEKEGVVSY